MSYTVSLPPEYPEPADMPDTLEDCRGEDEVDVEMGNNGKIGGHNSDNDSSNSGNNNNNSGSEDNEDRNCSGADRDEASAGDNAMTGETNIEQDDWTADDDGTNIGGMGGPSTMNGVSGNVVVRENNVVSSPLRYEKESYHLEQPTLT